MDLPEPDIPSVDGSLLPDGNPYLGMRNNPLSYIDPDERVPVIVLVVLAERRALSEPAGETAEPSVAWLGQLANLRYRAGGTRILRVEVSVGKSTTA